MKSKIIIYKDMEGRTLLTNGRHVSFSVGDRPAKSIGSERDHDASKELWEKITGRKLTAECMGETEYMNA